MIKVGFVTKSLTDGNALRGVGFYAKRLLPKLKAHCSEFNIEIYEINSDHELSTMNYELVHYPFFDLFYHTLPIFESAKTVVTVHDVVPLAFPDIYRPGIKGWINFQLQKLALKNTNIAIVDSFAAIAALKKYVGIEDAKIKFVHLAPDEIFKPKKVTKKYNLSKEFVLYVGGINWNKNIPNLVKACELACLPLVMVGKEAANIEKLDLTHPELRHLQNIDWSRVIRTGFVPDPDLVDIYNLASVYCQPSFAEGFGLNPLEALACGTPVASSNRGSLPEILGKNAVYFDPEDIRSMSQAIISSMNHKPRTTNSFSWDKTAIETLQIYQSLCP